jgi:hypothetical protein
MFAAIRLYVVLCTHGGAWSVGLPSCPSPKSLALWLMYANANRLPHYCQLCVCAAYSGVGSFRHHSNSRLLNPEGWAALHYASRRAYSGVTPRVGSVQVFAADGGVGSTLHHSNSRLLNPEGWAALHYATGSTYAGATPRFISFALQECIGLVEALWCLE